MKAAADLLPNDMSSPAPPSYAARSPRPGKAARLAAQTPRAGDTTVSTDGAGGSPEPDFSPSPVSGSPHAAPAERAGGDGGRGLPSRGDGARADDASMVQLADLEKEKVRVIPPLEVTSDSGLVAWQPRWPEPVLQQAALAEERGRWEEERQRWETERKRRWFAARRSCLGTCKKYCWTLTLSHLH